MSDINGEISVNLPSPSAGDWAVLKGYRTPDIRLIAKVTPKLLKFDGNRWPRQCSQSELLAALPSKSDAQRLAQALAGAAGQRDNRVRAGQEEFNSRREAAWEAYRKTEAKLVASAIEAASAGETAQTGSTEGERAARQGDA